MPVVRKWFSYRKADPAGKISSELDRINAEHWVPEWTEELNDLLTVLRRLVELEPGTGDLLDRVVAGPLLTTAELADAKVLPIPGAARRPHRYGHNLFSQD